MTKTFAENLREIRSKAGVSVPEISQHLISLGFKASEKTVYSWEAGRSRPSPDAFLEMCRFYGTGDDILEKFGYGVTETPKESETLMNEMERLLESLTPQQAALLLSVAKRMLGRVKAKAAQSESLPP